MSDDLNKAIKQLTDVLSQENLPDNLKGLLSMLAGSAGKEDTQTAASASSGSSASPEPKEYREEKNDQDDNLNNKIRNIVDRVNVQNDPRVALLYAIKPFLSSRKQKKLNNCVRLIQMSSLTRLLDDNEKGGLSKGD